MSKTTEDHLKNIEARLGETVEAFSILRKINEECNGEVNQKILDILNKRGAFWNPVLASLQTTVFTGMIAILDKNSKDSATLYLMIDELNKITPNSVPNNIATDLDVIRGRYGKFRHKLFGHNDIHREKIADDLNNAGFTWQSMSDDLAYLEYTFKVLWLVMRRDTIPTEAETKRMQFPYNDSVNRAIEHTSLFLSDLENSAS